MTGIEFASILRAFRERHALTKEAAAERLGVSPRTIEHWEIGRTTPRGVALKKILPRIGAAPETVSSVENSSAAHAAPRRRGRPPLALKMRKRGGRRNPAVAAVKRVVRVESANYDLPEHLL